MIVGPLQSIAFLEMPGGGEWMIIAFIALLIFGRRLPEVARSLGKSINEFKKGMREFQESASEVTKATNDVMSEADTQASQTTYETTPGYYDGQTAAEPTTETGTDQAVEPVAEDSNPDKPAQSTPTDTFQEPMS